MWFHNDLLWSLVVAVIHRKEVRSSLTAGLLLTGDAVGKAGQKTPSPNLDLSNLGFVRRFQVSPKLHIHTCRHDRRAVRLTVAEQKGVGRRSIHYDWR